MPILHPDLTKIIISYLAHQPLFSASLKKIQNAAAKVILQNKKREHQTHELLKELHWLPINQRHIFKILLLIHKSLNGKGPNYLKEMLSPKPDPRPLRSSSEQLLDISRTNLITYGDRAFSIFGPRKWNALPPRYQIMHFYQWI